MLKRKNMGNTNSNLKITRSGLKSTVAMPDTDSVVQPKESRLKLSTNRKNITEPEAVILPSGSLSFQGKKSITSDDTMHNAGKTLQKGKGTGDASSSRYKSFQKQKNCLAAILNDASKAMSELDAIGFKEKLGELCDKVNRETFKVQIVGTFKNGKSTFINSFLGESVLPAYALPCTAVINEVKYGETKRAVLHFKNPLPSQLPEELSAEALAHMNKHLMENVPPMEIPYDKIEDYVVIPMGKDPKDMLLESPYEKVELFWPLDLLENGIEIIDSPGLNEHSARTKVTMDYLNQADAIVFVLNATTLCSLDEMTFIENNLKARGFEDLFFVINRFDLIPEKEKSRIVKYAEIKLQEFTTFGKKGLFFLSAKEALDAKINNDSEKLENSGMTAFEKALSLFLTKHRGKLKLSAPAKELRHILQNEAIEKIIPRKKEMLNISVEDLKIRYDKIKPRLDQLTERKERLSEKILINIQKSKGVFKVMAERNYEQVLSFVPMWVNEFTPTSKIGVIPTKGKIKKVTDEISGHISSAMEQKIMQWQEEVLIPEMKRRGAKIFENTRNEIEKIMEEAFRAGEMISGADIENDIDVYKIGYNYMAVNGFKNGSGQVGKTFAHQIAGRMLMIMLSFTSPAALLGIAAFILVGAKKSETSVVSKLKTSIIKEITESMQSSKNEFIDSVSEGVTQFFTELTEKMISPIETEIEDIKQQIETAISDIENGENAAAEKREKIVCAEIKIKKIRTDIDKFISIIG